jgi:heme o synthase
MIQSMHQTVKSYLELTKPRIVMLAAFCAVIGMFLATPTLPSPQVLVFGTLGISLLAAAGFAFNCLVERGIDAKMARTRARPAARGEVGTVPNLVFSLGLGALGMGLLYWYVNPLTAWLTLATFVGYAVVYTVFLKPATPQNIVIGGASGAMPPLLGWTAVANEVTAPALILVLIIFIWTPPHFWALALYRVEDYKKSGLPMLPVTHGSEFTRLNILYYTILLLVTSILPFVVGMSGLFYLVCAVALGLGFLWLAWQLKKQYSDALSRKTFRYSILYLSLLFAALLIDHYL